MICGEQTGVEGEDGELDEGDGEEIGELMGEKKLGGRVSASILS